MAPMREVVKAHMRGGGSIGASFKFHWWVLDLSCGHSVERRVRWKPIPNPPRGFAALWQGVSLTRKPDPPKRARCEECLGSSSVKALYQRLAAEYDDTEPAVPDRRGGVAGDRYPF